MKLDAQQQFPGLLHWGSLFGIIDLCTDPATPKPWEEALCHHGQPDCIICTPQQAGNFRNKTPAVQREKITRIPSFIYINPFERRADVAGRGKDVLNVLKASRTTRKNTKPRVTRVKETPN